MVTRLLLSPLLALCILVSLPMTGWAQGVMARAAQTIVICKAHGPDVVVLDWQGQPVEVLPTCPDCALVAGPVPDASGQAVRLEGLVLTLSVSQSRTLHAGLGKNRSLWPRAPPV